MQWCVLVFVFQYLGGHSDGSRNKKIFREGDKKRKLTLSLARKIHNNCYGRLSSRVLIGQRFSLAFVRKRKEAFYEKIFVL